MLLIHILLFVIFQLLVVYPLGKLVLDLVELKLSWISNLVFGISIGIVILTILVLILGYTNNYNLLPLLVIIPSVLLFLQIRKTSIRKVNIRKILDKDSLIIASIIAFCILIQSLIVFPNGVNSDGNLRIKGVFAEDAMWHVAIINNLKKSIPPENPVFAGQKLVNYNYFSDIYIMAIQKFTNIDTLTLYFKLTGPFLAFLCAASLYFILKKLMGNQITAGIGVLLVTLSSTYYYFFALLKPGLNMSPSTFFGNEYVSRMVNYQLSFSYLIIATVIYLLLHRKNSFRFILIVSLLVSSGIGFKSYGTILIIFSLFIVGIYTLLRREYIFFKIAALSSIFTLILVKLFLQNNNATETVFAFSPFWMIENMMTDSLRLNSADWLAKRDHYLAAGNYLGISYLYIKGLAIFIFTQFGLKIAGFFSFIRLKKEKEKEVILLLTVMALGGILMPLGFTQGGVKWNTIQFIWYSGFGLGILLVLLISNLQKKIGLKPATVILLVVWVSYLPGVYKYSKSYLSDADNLTTYNFKGTQGAFQAAKFLSTQPDGTLLLEPVYSQTPFILSISKKNAYFADESTLSNLLVNWHQRQQEAKRFFDSSATFDYQENFLRKNNIAYIFTIKNRLEAVGFLDNIYSNKEISIYTLKK